MSIQLGLICHRLAEWNEMKETFLGTLKCPGVISQETLRFQSVGKKIVGFPFGRLDFRRSLVSGLPSSRRTAVRVSGKACL